MVKVANVRRMIKITLSPIQCRYENIKAPNLRPQIRVQLLKPNQQGYGPVQICFDLKNNDDPKKSKPLAFANLSPANSLELGIQLLFIGMRAYGMKIDSIVNYVRRRLQEIQGEIYFKAHEVD